MLYHWSQILKIKFHSRWSNYFSFFEYYDLNSSPYTNALFNLALLGLGLGAFTWYNRHHVSVREMVMKRYGIEADILYTYDHGNRDLYYAKLWITLYSTLQLLKNVIIHFIVIAYYTWTRDLQALLLPILGEMLGGIKYDLRSTLWNRLKLLLWASLVNRSQISFTIGQWIVTYLRKWYTTSYIIMYSLLAYLANVFLAYATGRSIFQWNYFNLPSSIRPWFPWYDKVEGGLQPGSLVEKLIELGMYLGLTGLMNHIDSTIVTDPAADSGADKVGTLLKSYPEYVKYQVYLYQVYRFISSRKDFSLYSNIVHNLVRSVWWSLFLSHIKKAVPVVPLLTDIVGMWVPSVGRLLDLLNKVANTSPEIQMMMRQAGTLTQGNLLEHGDQVLLNALYSVISVHLACFNKRISPMHRMVLRASDPVPQKPIKVPLVAKWRYLFGNIEKCVPVRRRRWFEWSERMWLLTTGFIVLISALFKGYFLFM